MANPKNIEKHQFKKGRSSEEAAKAGKKGGIASGEARRAAKTAKEYLALLNSLAAPEEFCKKMTALGVPESEQNLKMMRIISLHQKAVKGDVQAAKLIAQIEGELSDKTELSVEPIKVDVNVGVKLDDVIEALKSD